MGSDAGQDAPGSANPVVHRISGALLASEIPLGRLN